MTAWHHQPVGRVFNSRGNVQFEIHQPLQRRNYGFCQVALLAFVRLFDIKLTL
jgi:hypothetical protein